MPNRIFYNVLFIFTFTFSRPIVHPNQMAVINTQNTPAVLFTDCVSDSFLAVSKVASHLYFTIHDQFTSTVQTCHKSVQLQLLYHGPAEKKKESNLDKRVLKKTEHISYYLSSISQILQ